MVQRVASFRNRRYNAYVPACAYSAEVLHGAPYEVDFLTPIAASTTGILNGATLVAATAFSTFGSDTADAPFGRNVAAGILAGSVTVVGKDYLGQPMTELIATGAVGVKCFKWIDSVTSPTAGAHSLGFGAKLGLPFRMSSVLGEIGNGAPAAVGTLVAPSLTDPQTTTTTDPRGSYAPTTALTGSNRILASFLPYNILNANGNGGLFGLKHV